MITEELKQAWLDYFTDVVELFKDSDVDDFGTINDVDEEDINELLKMELVVKFKNDKE
jgi:hypothetical protein